MRNSLTLPTLRPSDVEVNPTFNVVIAYEDFETGKHAKRTYDFLVEHLGPDCQFSNQMWKFEVLAVSKLRDMAVKDAVGADIIIVSSHGSNELPREVKVWIDLWLKEKTNALALVALFKSPDGLENPVRSYLAEVARRGKMEFFAQPGVWPEEKPEEHGMGDWNRHGKTFSFLADIVQQQDRDTSHWGINE